MFGILLPIGLVGCKTTAPEATYGIQESHVSYTPARTLVLGCRPWPTGSFYRGQLPSNFPAAELNVLCQQFDDFVIRGFEGQPFMRGLSPKAVQKALDGANKSQYLGDLVHHWRHLGSECQTCTNPASFYLNSIAARPEWLVWLNDLSRWVRNGDAVLIPFVTYGNQAQYNERGMLVNQRRAGVVMYLIDTEKGSLIWAGGREAEVSNKKLAGSPGAPTPDTPSLEKLIERLFIDDMWRDFPGRQQF